MPHKRILFRSAARERVLRGATTLADAVRVTLGPKSKCVLIEKKWGAPLVCNDGVTIVKEIDRGSDGSRRQDRMVALQIHHDVVTPPGIEFGDRFAYPFRAAATAAAGHNDHFADGIDHRGDFRCVGRHGDRSGSTGHGRFPGPHNQRLSADVH